jgi:hypothetical protein
VTDELRSVAKKRILTRVQKDLSTPERALSKVIHQPAVDAVSDLGARTVGRPTGILTGSILAFTGSLLTLYICKHYGYNYNFLLFALLFSAGFPIGVALEGGWWLLMRRKRA